MARDGHVITCGGFRYRDQTEKSSPLLDLAEECGDLCETWEPPLELLRRW